VERFGLGCSKSTCGKVSESGFYTAPSRSRSSNGHRASVSRVIQTRLKSLSCRQPAALISALLQTSWNPTLRKERQRWAPAGGVCPRKSKARSKPNQNKIKSNGSGQECPLYRANSTAPLPLLGRALVPLCCRRRGILPLRKERAKMGHPGQGLSEEIKTKIKSKPNQDQSNAADRSVRSTLANPQTLIIERFGSCFDPSVVQGRCRAIA